MNGCAHPDRQYYRLICTNGTVHVTERCRLCGANTQPGRWIPHGELPLPVDAYPVLEDRRQNDDQPTLF